MLVLWECEKGGAGQREILCSTHSSIDSSCRGLCYSCLCPLHNNCSRVERQLGRNQSVDLASNPFEEAARPGYRAGYRKRSGMGRCHLCQEVVAGVLQNLVAVKGWHASSWRRTKDRLRRAYDFIEGHRESSEGGGQGLGARVVQLINDKSCRRLWPREESN